MSNGTAGTDLISIDIERGREYGLPCYNEFRQLCGMKKFKTFQEFTDEISIQVNRHLVF